MVCPSCGTENRAGRRFCSACGAAPLGPDDVRGLLARYFDTARTVIARYGGTVEQFIGRAVIGAWGTPVAKHDDAEGAVRTALEGHTVTA